MSGASPGAAWQRAEIAEEFLDRRQAVLPLIDVQEDLVRRIFTRRGREVERVLDVGAGDGAMSELMRSLYPRAQAVLVDFSEPMLARVQRRLGDGGWRAVRADLSSPGWREELPEGSYDAAVSSYAIHHLTAERKRALFAELFALLEPGGMFVNVDVVAIGAPLAGLFDEQMAANDAAVREAAGEIAHEHAESELFDDHEEDRPDPADSQLQWLREAGFEDVELHFKWAEGAIFGAVKPS
jgi:ubiquinone/menaquinone biosynthesis C-methylase UbiE